MPLDVVFRCLRDFIEARGSIHKIDTLDRKSRAPKDLSIVPRLVGFFDGAEQTSSCGASMVIQLTVNHSFRICMTQVEGPTHGMNSWHSGDFCVLLWFEVSIC